jgi:non-heme chloroperoxidase
MAYLKVNDISVYYEDDGAGPPLLFVHGWGTSGRVWSGQQPAFVEDHRVVVLDWRGCGRSDHPATGNTIDGVVADLVETIRLLDLQRPVVIGSSIGGVFATELGLRHPELVGGVVPVDSPAYWPAQGMDLDAIMTGIRQDRAGFLTSWVSTWYAPGSSPALVAWTIRQILDSGTFVEAHFAGVATYDPRPALPSLRVPIHYIHGALDAEIPVTVARDCAARTPGAELTVIAGAGHMAQQDRPAAFNAALRSALTTRLSPMPAA